MKLVPPLLTGSLATNLLGAAMLALRPCLAPPAAKRAPLRAALESADLNALFTHGWAAGFSATVVRALVLP